MAETHKGDHYSTKDEAISEQAPQSQKTQDRFGVSFLPILDLLKWMAINCFTGEDFRDSLRMCVFDLSFDFGQFCTFSRKKLY